MRKMPEMHGTVIEGNLEKNAVALEGIGLLKAKVITGFDIENNKELAPLNDDHYPICVTYPHTSKKHLRKLKRKLKKELDLKPTSSAKIGIYYWKKEYQPSPRQKPFEIIDNEDGSYKIKPLKRKKRIKGKEERKEGIVKEDAYVLYFSFKENQLTDALNLMDSIREWGTTYLLEDPDDLTSQRVENPEKDIIKFSWYNPRILLFGADEEKILAKRSRYHHVSRLCISKKNYTISTLVLDEKVEKVSSILAGYPCGKPSRRGVYLNPEFMDVI